MALLSYPLQAPGMVAELLLLNFSDHRMCGSGQCKSPTLAYLRRDDDLQLVWLNMANSRLTLLDRGPGQMPDILATEITQSGAAWQRRLVTRYEFVNRGDSMGYTGHMWGNVGASMPTGRAPIPALTPMQSQ